MTTGPAFEAIVIGGSAGGVTAVQQLLRTLPRAFDLPIALVLHIPPDRASGIPQLLGLHQFKLPKPPVKISAVFATGQNKT